MCTILSSLPLLYYFYTKNEQFHEFLKVMSLIVGFGGRGDFIKDTRLQ